MNKRQGMPRKRVWLSLPRVARMLSSSGEQVVELIHSGALPARLVGGARWFVALDDVDDFRLRRRGTGPRAA